MTDYTKLIEVCKPIVSEISVIKSVVESSINKEIDPLVIFFKDEEIKTTVVGFNKLSTFEDNILRFSEILHLYRALDSYSCIIAMPAKMSIDNVLYKTVNIFLLSDSDAWSIILPFLVENNNVKWYDEFSQITPINDCDFEDSSKEMISMFYFMTHIDNPAYNAAEIMSYLSLYNVAIHQFNDESNSNDTSYVSYFDMSSQN